MSKLNMKELINENIQKKDVVAMPIMTHPGIEMIGKTVRDAVTDGQVHYNAIKALSEKYPTAAATVIMDLTVEAEAFGAEIVFPENEVPSVVGRLLNDEEAIDKLEIPALNKGRVPQYLKANMLAAKTITDRSDFILRNCMAMKATGVNGDVMAEPAAGHLSDEDCTQYSSVFIKEIVEKVQDDHFTVILHNCGNTGHCTKAMVATGAAAYHFGNKIDMVEALKEVPADALAMGNLDPVSLFKAATPEVMKKATLDLLEATKFYPNFVLSSGCDTPPHTPSENIDAFFAALNGFNNA